jgi:MYXO-CTERM domain-containing protein
MGPVRSLAALLVLLPALASAHARLLSPTPRNARDDVKDGFGAPCGGPRSDNVHVLIAGSSLPLQWEETINHDGHFEILFSTANDQGFAFLKDPSGALLDNVPHSNSGGTPRPYSLTVQLPAQTCDACTLQLKQFMSATNSYYYSCADVRLVPPGSDLGVGPVDLGQGQSLALDLATVRDAATPGAPPSTVAGCAVGGARSSPPAGWLLLGALLLLGRRRTPRPT